MIERLFSFDSFDYIDDLTVMFVDCTLKVDIGPYPAGIEIDVIDFNFQTGVMQMYGSNGEIYDTLYFQLTEISND